MTSELVMCFVASIFDPPLLLVQIETVNAVWSGYPTTWKVTDEFCETVTGVGMSVLWVLIGRVHDPFVGGFGQQ